MNEKFRLTLFFLCYSFEEVEALIFNHRVKTLQVDKTREAWSHYERFNICKVVTIEAQFISSPSILVQTIHRYMEFLGENS